MKKKDLKKKAEKDYESMRKNIFYMQTVERIHSQVRANARKIEQNFIRFDPKVIKFPFKDYTNIWLMWIEHNIEKYEFDMFEDYKSSPTAINQFWNANDLFDNCAEMNWPIKFTQKAKNTLQSWSFSIREILLNKLIEFSIGRISVGENCEIISEGPCENMVFLETKIKGSHSKIIFALLMDRLPIVESGVLTKFYYFQYLKVIELADSDASSYKSVEIFKRKIENDPDRWLPPAKDSFSNIIHTKFCNSVNVNSLGQVMPKPMKIEQLSTKKMNSYILNKETSRWERIKVKKEKIEKVIDPYESTLIESLGNAKSCTEFIGFLKRIPDFKVRLTEEQEKLIGSSGNVLAIGRSGTGKTTCSIFRLLSTEILYRFTLSGKKKAFTAEDITKSGSLHTVFITASPVLTNEVKNYYEKLKDHIKDKLKKKEKPKIKDPEEFEEINIINDDIIEEESEEETEGLSSMNFLNDEDFPLFVTARKVIFMIDSAMSDPFFARDKKGGVIGSTSKFQWHNEYKGTLMINKQFKQQRQTKDLGDLKDLSSDSDSDADLEVDFPKQKANKKIIAEARENFTKKSFRHISFEVDFSVFSNKFYPKIKLKYKYSPLLLWTEFSAYIKGSANSYKFYGYYLPRQSYINMGRKSSMLTEDEKSEIWNIFIEYERWKVSENAYDMQDVVNYLLNQLSYYKYTGAPIHYMMIDEVQDLTPATLNLLLTITKENLFFSGDTAQTIAKGVGFRFCDLKSLFIESQLEAPKVCQLTMNFRTHKQILVLANSVVTLLETFFPLTIDKMAKEISAIEGPKPIVLLSTSTEILHTIMFGSSTEAPELGCNQVIIVRNQESKDTIPDLLKHALCLTVYEAKGLEFDDVILYNFFTESEAHINMWNILRSIQGVKETEESSNESLQTLDELERMLPKLKTNIQPNNANYSLLCTELKHLYVAVTRPKKRLIIFDEDRTLRKPIENFWTLMQAVDFVDVSTESGGLAKVFINGFAQKTSDAEWKQQGLRMFSHKYYEQAEKCFTFAKEPFLAMRAKGYALANKAENILADVESGLEQQKSIGKFVPRAMRKEARLKKAFATSLFIEAAEAFLSVSKDNSLNQTKILKEAARCFASGNKHERAAEIFKLIQLYGQAAESKIICGEYEEAGDLFVLKSEYQRAIEAYKLGGCWDHIVKTIYLFKDQMEFNHRQKLIQKYVPAALEELTPKLLENTEQDTSYIPQITQEIQMVIKESSGESDSDSDEIREEANETIEKPIEREVLEQKEGVRDDRNMTESFELLSKDSSFSLLSSGLEDVDASDEWLQLETGSAVESLASLINPDGSIVSDFSVLEAPNTPALGLKLIKTRGDIFIEDTAMRKIIEYISMFSEEVTSYLKSLRSSESLLSSIVIKEDWELVNLIDLDELSPEMLGLILDTLEEYGMYRLCLVVCNRYNLIERAGRFIVSLAFKYSNLSQITYPGYKLNSKLQIQRAAIAFTALHNVLEMINPCYLDVKNQRFAFSVETFQGLILLGYWKKAVFLLERDIALNVAWGFGEFGVFKNIYCSGQTEGGKWMPNEIKTLKDVEAWIVGMDAYTLAALKIRLSIDKSPSDNFTYTSKVFNAIESGVDITADLVSGSKRVNDYFSLGQPVSLSASLEIYDLINAFSLLLQSLKSENLYNLLLNLSSNDFSQLLYTFNYLMVQLKSPKGPNQEYLRHCILSSAGVRSIPHSPIFSVFPLYTHSILLQSSPLCSGILSDRLYSIDLECQCFLSSNEEIIKAYTNIVSPLLLWVIEARSRNNESIHKRLDSFGEFWMAKFIFNRNPYSLKTFDYMQSLDSKNYQEYLWLLSRLETLKGLETADKEYIAYMEEKNFKKILKVQKQINNVEKTMSKTQPIERIIAIHELVAETKFYTDDYFKLTSITRQALLTSAQILMRTSENEEGVKRTSSIWMAYELCRVSDNLIVFIEMLRARSRQILVNNKKAYKLSSVYEIASGFADISVYHKIGCFDGVTDTILKMLEDAEFDDDLKVYLLRKAATYWVFSNAVYDGSLEKFMKKPEGTVKLYKGMRKFIGLNNSEVSISEGHMQSEILQSCCNALLEFAVKPIPDDIKQKYLNAIANFIMGVLIAGKPNLIVDKILREFKNKNVFGVAKSFLPRHQLFQAVHEFPNFKKLEYTSMVVKYKEYPQELLDKEWFKETRMISAHQFAANVVRRNIKKSYHKSYSGLVEREYSNQTGKVLNTSLSNVLKAYNDHLADLFRSLYRIILLKSLDMHFLLDQISMVANEIKGLHIGDPVQKISKIREAMCRFVGWKKMVKPVGEEAKAKVKKKWNVNWKRRAVMFKAKK